MVFVALAGIKLLKAPGMRVSFCGVKVPLKSVHTLIVPAEVPAVDGYCIAFVITCDTVRLLTLAERVACAEDHSIFLSRIVCNANVRIDALAQPADVMI